MICTNCCKEDGIDQDLSGLPANAAIKLCCEWLCNECMDQGEAIERTTAGADKGEAS